MNFRLLGKSSRFRYHHSLSASESSGEEARCEDEAAAGREHVAGVVAAAAASDVAVGGVRRRLSQPLIQQWKQLG